MVTKKEKGMKKIALMLAVILMMSFSSSLSVLADDSIIVPESETVLLDESVSVDDEQEKEVPDDGIDIDKNDDSEPSIIEENTDADEAPNAEQPAEEQKERQPVRANLALIPLKSSSSNDNSSDAPLLGGEKPNYGSDKVNVGYSWKGSAPMLDPPSSVKVKEDTDDYRLSAVPSVGTQVEGVKNGKNGVYAFKGWTSAKSWSNKSGTYKNNVNISKNGTIDVEERDIMVYGEWDFTKKSVEPDVKYYTITWVVDGKVAATTKVKEGDVPTYANPSKDYGVFAGWSTVQNSYANITTPAAATSDATYYAIFTRSAYFYLLRPGKEFTSGNAKDYIYSGEGTVVIPDTYTISSSNRLRWYSGETHNGTVFDTYDYIISEPADSEIVKSLKMLGYDTDRITWSANWYTYSTASPSDDRNLNRFDDSLTIHIDGSVSVQQISSSDLTYIVTAPDGRTQSQVRTHDNDTTVEINSTVDLTKATFTTDGYTYDSEKSENNKKYIFDGWYTDASYSVNAADSIKVNGNLTYYGKYTEQDIEYTVEFTDWDDSRISIKSDYSYDETLIVPTAPSRDTDNYNAYTFLGWDGNNDGTADTLPATVQKNATYKAVYKATPIVYTVIFYNEDGTTEIGKGTYGYGDALVVPSDPTKLSDGTYTYVFNGWDKKEFDATADTLPATVTANAEYKALFASSYIDYEVTFLDEDGTTVLGNKADYHYNDDVVKPADPSKVADETYTYAFAGWDADDDGAVDIVPATVTANATYKAIYTSTYIDYEVTFLDEDGTTVLGNKADYHYNDDVVKPADPSKAADETYTYAFAGWDADDDGAVDIVPATVTANATYKAIYTSTYIDYEVTFLDEDGTTVLGNKADYHYNDDVVKPADPSKAADETYTYAFAGWDADDDGTVDTVPATVTANATYKAIYTSTYIDYEVTFLDEDGTTVLGNKADYHYNDDVVKPADPSKVADETYTYAFAGWDADDDGTVDTVPATVTANATYKAIYTSTYIDYEVTFLDEDGTTVLGNKADYHYNDDVVKPADPSKAADETYTYAFAGWDADDDGAVDIVPATVTANATYKAIYTSTYIDYEVTFLDEDGTTVLGNKADYHYNDDVVKPADPSKAADETYTYAFAGWDADDDGAVDTVPATVTANATYKAVYTSTYIDYTVIYDLKGGTSSEQLTYTGLHNGDNTPKIADPTPPSDAYYTYEFTGWSPTVDEKVTGNKTYEATYKAKTFTATIEVYYQNMGQSGYSYAAGQNYDFQNVQEFLDTKIDGFDFGGVDFFERGNDDPDGKAYVYTMSNPAYTGIYYDGYEYGAAPSGKSQLNNEGRNNNSITAKALTDALNKGNVTIKYYYTQIIHIKADNKYDLTYGTNGVETTRQVYDINTDAGVFIRANLTDTLTPGKFNHTGWKIGGVDYAYSGDTKVGVNQVVSRYSQFVQTKLESGINQLWLSFESKWEQDIRYTVNYYVDGSLRESFPETVAAADNVSSVPITVSAADDRYSGYLLDMTLKPNPLPTTAANGDVINIYYKKDDGQNKNITYTVRYFTDGSEVLADRIVSSNTVWINDPDTLPVSISAENNRYTGYVLDTAATGTIPSTVKNGDIVDIFYVRDDTQTKNITYTVQYMLDGTPAAGETETVSVTVWINDPDTVVVSGVLPKTFIGYTLTSYSEAFPATIINGGVIYVYYTSDPIIPPEIPPTITIADTTPPTGPAPTITIPDEPTPMASSAAWALVNLICTILTALAAIYTLFAKRKEKTDENENEYLTDDSEDKKKRKARFAKSAKIIGIALTLIAVITFILTEDMGLRMVLVDKWTILMVAYAVFQAVDMIIGKTDKKSDDKKETARA